MKLKKIILVVIFLFCLTGCKGDDIRDFKSQGYTLLDDKFVCKELKNQSFKYLYDNYGILEDGTIYDLSFDLIYQNKNNCKLVDENNKVYSSYNGEVFKSNDQNYYKFEHPNNSSYTIADDNNKLAKFLLNDNNIVKVVNASDNNYYVLKKDGNVYRYVITGIDNSYKIDFVNLVFNKEDYNGDIIDFGYDSNMIFLKTNEKYYTNQVVNEECKKYADVDCEYEIREDKYLNKYKAKIWGYNGKLLILKNGRVLNYSDS